MRIKKLVLQGFKSFNTKTEILMPGGFICITGPNGSGKSNLSDALSFVFGELSSKGLRTESFSSLIFNGGSGGKPAKFARVSLVLDNSSRSLSVDSDEVVISREVRSNGQTVYKLNGRIVTRGRVVSLLDEVGVVSNGYWFVRQGEIVRFVEMNDIDRAELIKGIAGISVYEDKKSKALKELEKVRAKLGEVKIVLDQKGEQLREIDRERREAERFNQMVNRLKVLRVSFLSRDLRVLEERLAKVRGVVDRLVKKRDELREEVSGVEELLVKLREELSGVDEEIQRMGGKDKESLRREIDGLKEELSDLRVEHFSAKREKERLMVDVNGLVKRLDLVKQRRVVLKRELDKVVGELRGLEEELRVFDESNSLALKKQDKLFELQLRLNSVNNELVKKKGLSGKVSRVGELEKRKKFLESELEKCREELSGVEGSLSSVSGEESVVSARIGELKGVVSELEKRVSVLRSRVRDGDSFGKVLEFLRGVSGVIGSVWECCRVPEGLRLPISLAMGGDRNAVIVRDDSVAEKCIELLKEKRLGWVKFYPLNSVKGFSFEKRFSGDGVIGYAVDLVEFSPEFVNVFSRVFGDCLVVRDFSVARRIGLGRVRMVSLSGELFERSGAVSGGFRKSLNELSVKLRELEDELRVRGEELVSLSSKREELLERVIGLREERSALRERVDKLGEELSGVVEELNGLSDGGKLVESVNRLEEEKARLEREIEELSSVDDSSVLLEREALVERLQGLKLRKSSLLDKLGLVESEVGEVGERLSSLRERLSALDDVISSSGKRLSELSKLVVVREREFSKLDDRIDKLYARRSRLVKRIDREENRLRSKRERLLKFDSLIAKREVKVGELSSRVELLRERLLEFEGVEPIRLVNLDERRKELEELERAVSSAGPINQRAIERFEVVKAEFDELSEKFNVVKGEELEVLKLIEEIDSKKESAFLRAFSVVKESFERLFKELTSGEGLLELCDPENLLDGGVSIRVRTRKEKRVTHVRSLSGGEKTITAIALIMALQEFQPSPFYIMDEVDAALDKENSEKLAELIKRYSRKSQFILISHNDSVISMCDYLYGVSMNKLGESRVVGIKL